MTAEGRNTILTAALRYAARGIPVFPCNPRTKAPLVPSREDMERGHALIAGEERPVEKGDGGFKLATTDEATIRAWWRRWPKALIGMPTGRGVGVMVVDLDPKLHSADDMLAALQRFAATREGEALPPCPLVRTQSGGLHLWFAYPDIPAPADRERAEKSDNRTHLFKKAWENGLAVPEAIRLHVDIRGDNGYVILPPSQMHDGKTYEWEQAAFDLGPDPYPPLPERILDAVLKRGEFAPKQVRAAEREPLQAQGGEHRPPPRATASEDAHLRKYAANALIAECDELRKAVPGERHNALNRAAFNLGTLVGAGVLSENVAYSAVKDAAQWPGSTWTKKEEDTIADGLAAGIARPRDLSGIAANSRPQRQRRAPGARPHSPSASTGSPPPPGGEGRDSSRPLAPLSGNERHADNPREDEAEGDAEFDGEDFEGGENEGSEGGAPPTSGDGGRREPAWAIAKRLSADSDRLWRSIAQPQNDVGNAQRLLIWFGDEVMYVRDVGWHKWTGTHWEREGGEEHATRCAQIVSELIDIEADEMSVSKREQFILDEAEGISRETEDKDEKRALAAADAVRAALQARKRSRRKFGVSSGNMAKVKAMMQAASPHCAVAVTDLDRDPFAFNVANGTLKWRRVLAREAAGDAKAIYRFEVALHDHNRRDFITKCARVAYDPDAERIKWDAFLERFLPSDPVRHFVKVFFGYGLAGHASSQALIYLYGHGANGKSVMIESIARVMGGYLQMLPKEAIAGMEQRRGDQASPELARLPGARVVRVSELEKGQKLKEAMIKELTGGEPILTRHLHQGFFEFKPIFKPVLSSNHKPEIYNSDEGIWRRVNLVHFNVTIPLAERKPFDEVVEDLLTDASGILNWLVEGLESYTLEGLQPPEEVQLATAEHRDDMDPIKRFVRHCVTVHLDPDEPRPWDEDKDFKPPEEHRVGARQMFEAFNSWLEANGARKWSETQFGRDMGGRADTFGFKRFDERLRFYWPVSLHDVPEPEAAPAQRSWTHPREADPGWQPPEGT